MDFNNAPCFCAHHSHRTQAPQASVQETPLITASEVIKGYADRAYTTGHPVFNGLMVEMMKLHSMKNAGYAGSTPLGNFERTSKILALYKPFPPTPYTSATMFILKHYDRIMLDVSEGRAPSDEALADIAVYATIMRCMNKDGKLL